MKHTSSYNDQFDAFDVPNNLWDRVEEELDANEKKRRAFIWIRVAAIAAVVIVSGAFAINYWGMNDSVAVANNFNQLPRESGATVSVELEDSVEVKPEEKEYEFVTIRPLAYTPDSSKFKIIKLKKDTEALRKIMKQHIAEFSVKDSIDSNQIQPAPGFVTPQLASVSPKLDTTKTIDSTQTWLEMIANGTLNVKDKDGRKQGKWIYFGKDRPSVGYPALGIVEKGSYVNDRKEGLWVKYHKDGKTPRISGEYKLNRPNGSYTKFYGNGTIKEIGTYSRSKHVGSLVRYHENGNVQYQANYDQNGREQGEVKYYFPSGQEEWTYSAQNGVPQGNATRYYANGDVKEVLNHTPGSQLAVTSKETVTPPNNQGLITQSQALFGTTHANGTFNRNEVLRPNSQGIHLGYYNAEYNNNGDVLLFTSRRQSFENGLGSDIYVINRDGSTYQWSEPVNTSHYDEIVENDFLAVNQAPLSTFSIDVDGASYSDVRGAINRGRLPNPNAVRLEEFVNYFPYEYEEPQGEHPFSIHSEVAVCPWNTERQLLKVGIKGQSIEKQQLPKNNLVFLLDVSGSMDRPEKIELLKKGFRLLVNELREEDRVSIAVYAGAAGLVLPPTSGANKDRIMDALNRLKAGGSTAGGQGIKLAYSLAEEYFDPNGNNRVILATDGDFNVGISNDDKLVKLIEEKRKTGVFLTVLGFGHDNFQSSKMEKLANNGNGNFSFIDNIMEAKKVLVTEMGATLQTIAKDVKIQIEFNPEVVEGHRLIGYENRLLKNEDFANDTVDAGELGAGHTVTALYEIIPTQQNDSLKASLDSGLKYSEPNRQPSYGSLAEFPDQYATVKFRYKAPNGDKSTLIEEVIFTNELDQKDSEDFKFIQSVVEFGLILRNSKYKGDANFERILERATSSKGEDAFGYRKEFIEVVKKARAIWNGEDVQ